MFGPFFPLLFCSRRFPFVAQSPLFKTPLFNEEANKRYGDVFSLKTDTFKTSITFISGPSNSSFSLSLTVSILAFPTPLHQYHHCCVSACQSGTLVSSHLPLCCGNEEAVTCHINKGGKKMGHIMWRYSAESRTAG